MPVLLGYLSGKDIDSLVLPPPRGWDVLDNIQVDNLVLHRLRRSIYLYFLHYHRHELCADLRPVAPVRSWLQDAIQVLFLKLCICKLDGYWRFERGVGSVQCTVTGILALQSYDFT
jgi:hypothetical protein